MAVPASPPLSYQQIEGIISSFKDQEGAVQTLISTGTLTMESQGAQTDAEVMIVACRKSSRIRIEITHAWGRPLLHILVDGTALDILSFSEKRHYRGHLGSPLLLKQIPFPLDADLLWSLARAYPVLRPYQQAHSKRAGQIVLTDTHTVDTQVLDLYPESNLPRRVSSYPQGTVISFSNFEKSNGLIYGGKIDVSDAEDTYRLTLDIRKMIFNQSVPDAIFHQNALEGFEQVHL